MSSVLKVDEIQNTDGKTGLVITPDGSIDGIKFPEEANPSDRTITNTTMSSYEEGTFIPMATTVADVYHARYTKIGNLVTLNCCFRMKAGQSQDCIFLPFIPANDGAGTNTGSNMAVSNRYAGTVSYLTPDSKNTPINVMLFHQGNQGARAFFISKNSTTQQSWPSKIDDSFGEVGVSFTYQTNE